MIISTMNRQTMVERVGRVERSAGEDATDHKARDARLVRARTSARREAVGSTHPARSRSGCAYTFLACGRKSIDGVWRNPRKLPV